MIFLAREKKIEMLLLEKFRFFIQSLVRLSKATRKMYQENVEKIVKTWFFGSRKKKCRNFCIGKK